MEGPLFVSFLIVGMVLENGRTGYINDDTYLYSWGLKCERIGIVTQFNL